MANKSRFEGDFFQRVLVASATVISMLLVLLFLQQVASILLILFAAILFAIFLDAGAYFIRRRSEMAQGWAVALFFFVVLMLLTGAGWLTGPQVAEQGRQLGERIPEAWEQLQEIIMGFELGEEVMERTPDPEQLVPGTDILGRITGVFSAALSGVVNFGLIIVIGFYLAINPKRYIDAFVYLIPKRHRQRGYEIFGGLGHALRWWLVGQLAEMVVIGVLTTIGFLIVGVPMAVPLGLIAGLLAFIPYLGPILSLIPALMVAFVEGPTMVLYVLIVYVIVQNLESNLITPLIQLYAVSLPPAMLIASQILFGFMFGFIGIVIATPLTIAILVLIQMLYVEDVLGDKVTLMGMGDPHEVKTAGSGEAAETS